MKRYDLVCFDMDGVLTALRSSWHWLNLCLDVDNDETYRAYISGEIDQPEFMRRDISQWKAVKPDIRISDLIRFFQNMPLTEGIQETVACLKSNGIRCVIVSGGVDIAARMIAEEFGFDDYVADGICSNPDGTLTGEGMMNVDLNDKGISVRRFIEKYGTTKDRTVSIGNSYTDIPMFRDSGVSIAFNPTDDFTKEAATYVVQSGNISDVLDHILPCDDCQSLSKSNPS
ncbi:MAG: HAD family phosphatase [Methanomassiliicoccaceae archaeon]|nr:HAD family phosphatase [Methanomassiliicoccaceae archaeon]